MTDVPLKNLAGEVVGTVELDERVFGITPNRAVLHQAVVAQLANRRKGTHDTKTRAEVAGGTRVRAAPAVLSPGLAAQDAAPRDALGALGKTR
jgi:ribosomal protein L4